MTMLILTLVAVTAALYVTDAGARSSLSDAVAFQRAQTWRWQDTMLRQRSDTAFHERKTRSKPYLRWLVRHWKVRHLSARIRAHRPPNLSFWMCVHSREGSWTDPNAPYYGGLQMGMWFMRTYGWNLLQRKGTADNWTRLEQIWVAERAWRWEGYSRAWLFGQWPNTAPPCA